MSVEAAIGTVRTQLVCAACGTTVGPIFVEAHLDDDGDVAVTASQVAWFLDAHYAPAIELMP